jgi:hypothetical protein
MTTDDFGVTPPTALSGAVPARKSDNKLAHPPARRQPGKRRPAHGPKPSSDAPESTEPGTGPAGAQRPPLDEDGESHVDCFI